MSQEELIRYGVLGAALALALFLRIRRIGRMERLRLRTLWIIPTIFTGFAAMILWQFPPSVFGWLWIGPGFAVGGMLGWWRARLVDVSVDPTTGELMQRSSPAALVFLAVLMMVRWGVRYVVMLGDQRWHFGAMLISDIFIAVAVGVLGLYRIELYLRARKLLRSA